MRPAWPKKPTQRGLTVVEATELQRLVRAGRKHHSSRACTYPGCGNQHRAANPLIAASGPLSVAGAPSLFEGVLWVVLHHRWVGAVRCVTDALLRVIVVRQLVVDARLLWLVWFGNGCWGFA